MGSAIYTWTPTTPTGFLNDEFRHIWEAQNPIFLAAMDHRFSTSTTALNGFPVIVFPDGATNNGGATFKRPLSWINGGAVTIVDYWQANNVAGSQVVTLEENLKARQVGGSSVFDIIAVSHQDITLPTTAYEVFTVTYTAAAISDLEDADLLRVRPRRLGADGADNYTADVYYVGSYIYYTPA